MKIVDFLNFQNREIGRSWVRLQKISKWLKFLNAQGAFVELFGRLYVIFWQTLIVADAKLHGEHEFDVHEHFGDRWSQPFWFLVPDLQFLHFSHFFLRHQKFLPNFFEKFWIISFSISNSKGLPKYHFPSPLCVHLFSVLGMFQIVEHLCNFVRDDVVRTNYVKSLLRGAANWLWTSLSPSTYLFFKMTLSIKHPRIFFLVVFWPILACLLVHFKKMTLKHQNLGLRVWDFGFWSLPVDHKPQFLL